MKPIQSQTHVLDRIKTTKKESLSPNSAAEAVNHTKKNSCFLHTDYVTIQTRNRAAKKNNNISVETRNYKDKLF